MYQTIEARLENNKVIFKNDFQVPKKNVKVLITFLDLEEENKNILSINDNEYQDEKNLDGALKSDKVKNKFKELSNLISKWN